MSIHIKNISNEILHFSDCGFTLTPGTTIEINKEEDLEKASQSTLLLSYIANGKVQASDDIRILTLDEAVRKISGISIIAGPRDKSGKLRVHQTSRALGTTTCFAGCGDDPSNIMSVGGGTDCVFHHNVGDATTQVYYIDFNIIENETWVHEGYLTWSTCKYDRVTCDVVPVVTNTVPGENTNYSIYGGYLIIPSPGTGDVNLASDITHPWGGLIRMPLNDLGEHPTAYWNADYNSSTKLYENINYAMGDGQFNMFSSEVPTFRMFNRVPLLDNGFQELRTSDTAQLGHGMRFKITCETNGDDHEWGFAFTFVLHRKRSI